MLPIKILHCYECKEGIHIGNMKDTTIFWATDTIELDRTIWSLVDVDGFVLETKYQNGIKKVVRNIQWETIDDSFFKAQIDTIKTYHKKSYHGIKIVEAEWELNYYKKRLRKYEKMQEDSEITLKKLEEIQQQFQSLFETIEDRIRELQKRAENQYENNLPLLITCL